MEIVPTSYDIVPYAGNPYRESHPDHLATVARLFGLAAPPVDACRVLELGCASGANLIPMGVAVPGARFLGIDLSQRQVEEGRRTIQSLRLENVELRHGSIAEIGAEHGEFDYIICHGVFSWVPREIQDHILQVCSQNLAPDGVAYVSYNTYPGWFMRGMVRRMMGFHARQFSDPATQLEQARALLDFLFQASSGVDATYHALLSRELNILRKCNDSYVFHEHLEEINEPLFFHEFAERAAAHGLRYLAEPHVSEMVAVNVPSDVSQVLARLGANIIHFEQYLDFLRNRTFRRTLLCHERQVPRREIGPDRLRDFWLASPLSRKGAGAELAGPDEWEFAGAGQRSVKVSSPVHKAALTCLERIWPASLKCDALAQAAKDLLETAGSTSRDMNSDLAQIEGLALPLYLQHLLEVSSAPARFARRVGPFPRASGLARLQAGEGTIVTNLRHERVKLSPLDRELVRQLDGSRDRDSLRELLDTSLLGGELTIRNESGLLPPEQRTPELLSTVLEHSLASIARQALLLDLEIPL
ncbi:MAG TPA: methyltransferase regulatory domain-containing protein [Planctomycetaceae bacterium]|nr:methyltransferase regulatory domain-containing protein [Planctomycetaceae bacterium]